MTERELHMLRIKHLRWGRYVQVSANIDLELLFGLLYWLFLRLAIELGFDVQRGAAIFDYHLHRIDDLLDESLALIAEAERAGGAHD